MNERIKKAVFAAVITTAALAASASPARAQAQGEVGRKVVAVVHEKAQPQQPFSVMLSRGQRVVLLGALKGHPDGWRVEDAGDERGVLRLQARGLAADLYYVPDPAKRGVLTYSMTVGEDGLAVLSSWRVVRTAGCPEKLCLEQLADTDSTPAQIINEFITFWKNAPASPAPEAR